MVNGYKPRSLAEALSLRRTTAAVPFAGGTDLMVRADDSAVYLYLDGCEEFRRVDTDGKWIHIGAGCTFTQLQEEPLVPGLLKAAAAGVGAPAIRNMGTLGGNLINGSGKADGVCALYACGAQVTLASETGRRTMNVEKLYRGARGVNLAADELLCEILVPAAGLENWTYEKVGGREALAVSRVSFAGVCRWEEGRLAALTAAFGGVAPQVLRFPEFEREMLGRTAEEAKALRADYLDAYGRAIRPTEGRVSADYRRRVCRNLLTDFLDCNGI